MPRKPMVGVRIEPELKRRLVERARVRSITEGALVRELISIGLGGNDARMESVASSLDALRRQIENFAQMEEGVSSQKQRRQAALTQLLERVLIQSTEMLMIMRVVTYQDRPADYALAMKKTQELLTGKSPGTTHPVAGAVLPQGEPS